MEPANLTGDALVAAHKDVVRKMRMLTIAFPIVLIVVVVGNLTAIGNQFKNLDTQAVGNDLTQRAGMLMPEFEGYLSEVADAALPALTQAMEQESATMAPIVQQRLQQDMEGLMATLESEFRLSAEKSLDEAREKQREMLVLEFPALADNRVAQDAILAATHEATVKWATDRFNVALKEHMAALEEIRKTLEKSYTAPKGEVAAPEDALMAWLELLNERVGAHSVLAPDDSTEVVRKIPLEQAE